MIIKIINMTPHPIVILDEKNELKRTFQTEGLIRLKSEVKRVEEIEGVPISSTLFGEPEGLPDYEVGTFFIVSQLIKSALPGRKDLLVPAEVVRDENGNIIGCRSLGK